MTIDGLLTQVAALDPGEVSSMGSDFAKLVLAETAGQKPRHKIDDVEDFLLASDALNFGRLRMRFRSESERLPPSIPALETSIAIAICEMRDYSLEDFSLAAKATQSRVRFPLGTDPLAAAFADAMSEPIKLIASELAESSTCTHVAGIAYHLSIRLKGRSLLLPVEGIRDLLHKRKITVTGAISQLEDFGLLRQLPGAVHTGRAREFEFTGREGVHFTRNALARNSTTVNAVAT